MGREDLGLLNTGETINLRENSPPNSICKDGDSSYSQSSTDTKWYIKFWRRDMLMIFIIIAVLLGFLVGITCNKPIQNLEEPTRSTVLTFLGFPGEILMRMLKMLILPLIVTSLIVGLAELDQRASGRLGMRAVCYYMATTLFAVILGIILVVAINPGSKASPSDEKEDRKVRALDSFLDLIRNMFPDNLIKACIAQLTTDVKVIKANVRKHIVNYGIMSLNESKLINSTRDIMMETVNGSTVLFYETWDNVTVAGKGKYGGSTNILGLVVFSLAVGLILGKMGDKAKGFVNWMKTLNDVVMELVTWVMWYSPIGIWSLIAAKFASMNNILGTFESLGLYMVTVISGLLIHSLIVLPLIYFVTTRRNPLLYVKGIVQALLTAFGTSSSSATLPVTFRCLEETNRIDKRVTRFVLPIGATINMDGTALYEAVAAIFIAQASGLNLNLGQYIAVSLTSTLASIGAAGIPQAGLVTMLIVLQTIGLPEDAITLIIAVDWFLDRVRTTVNVLGDAFGAGIVAHLSKADLLEMDRHHEEEMRRNQVAVAPPKPDPNAHHVNLYTGMTAF